MNTNPDIRSYGLFSTIVVTIIGVGIFSYPREITERINNDGWIATILAGFIFLFVTYIIYSTIKINDFRPFSEIIKDNFGNFLGSIILIFFSIYVITLIAIQMRVFVEVVKKYLLYRTPVEFLLMVTILAGAYVIRAGFNNIVRFNEIAYMIMIIPLVLVFFILLKQADFTNILPIMRSDIRQYPVAIYESLLPFTGIEIMYLILPIMKQRREMKKTAYKAIIITTIFYTIITILCIAVLTTSETKIMRWPTIVMVTSIDLPGLFVERWEGVIMTLWILFYFSTFINLFYFSCDIVKEVFKLEDIKLGLIFTLPIVYLIAIYPENIPEVYFFTKVIIRTMIIFNVIVLPLILYIISNIRLKNRKGQIDHEKA